MGARVGHDEKGAGGFLWREVLGACVDEVRNSESVKMCCFLVSYIASKARENCKIP
jgi:hypothetical protein